MVNERCACGGVMQAVPEAGVAVRCCTACEHVTEGCPSCGAPALQHIPEAGAVLACPACEFAVVPQAVETIVPGYNEAAFRRPGVRRGE